MLPIFETLKTKTNESNITGRPVANENTEGMTIPSEYDKARGISIPKKRTALNGQKAKAKIEPKKRLPI